MYAQYDTNMYVYQHVGFVFVWFMVIRFMVVRFMGQLAKQWQCHLWYMH